MQLHPSDIAGSRVLISPLDWGMGHTTRCVALIQKLLDQNNTVIFAGNNLQRDFMQREFPGLMTTHLDGYRISLDSQKSTYVQMLRQLLKIIRAVRKENKWIRNFARNEKIDVVVSDNRYGLFTGSTKNIILTHQLNLQVPYMRSLVNRRVKKWLQKFDCVWIPDDLENPICGELTKAELNIPKIFIGHLSRFKKTPVEMKYDLLAILSGPEPGRSNFGKKLVEYLGRTNKKCALVGTEGRHPGIEFFSNPTTAALEKLINESGQIISRAGYTTIMEMVALEKKSSLIPTPGQFEQEYLADNVRFPFLTFQKESDFFQAK